MPRSGCSALHGVNPNLKKDIFALHSDRQLLNFLKNQIKIKDIFLTGDLFHC